ncbi:MAG: hypothetical protein CMF50_10750 [Legionellales bacterium]|nr:hypothetical protein [Legionellales bacterium]
MKKSIAISDELYEMASCIAKKRNCSADSQIEYWIKIGKCIDDNPDLPVQFIDEVLKSKNYNGKDAKPFKFRGEK